MTSSRPSQWEMKADFLELAGRRLFYLLLDPPPERLRGSLLFLPPFAEEMNLSRRVVAGQARVLADAGYRVMLLDLTGCGDASGEFVDATWTLWREDAMFAAQRLGAMGDGTLSLWGLRLGALLATDIAQNLHGINSLLLWQPVLNGEQQVDQFLRLRAASAVLNNAVAFDRKSLWSELREGRSLHIAGYELSSSLALELSKIRLNNCLPPCTAGWLEIGRADAKTLPPASNRVVENWSEQGISVHAQRAPGESFWRSVAADEDPQLYAATLELFEQLGTS